MQERGLFFRKAPSLALPPEKIDVGEILGGKPLLSEKRRSPRISPKNVSSGGSAREGASLQRSPLPRNHPLFSLHTKQYCLRLKFFSTTS